MTYFEIKNFLYVSLVAGLMDPLLSDGVQYFISFDSLYRRPQSYVPFFLGVARLLKKSDFTEI
jgi:hypothetical protein